MALLTVPGDPAKPASITTALEKAAGHLGRRTSTGSRAAAARSGMRPSTIPSTTCCISAPAMARRGIARCAIPTDGDNLYVASLIAVKPDTGEYVWHYQATPGDSWDYDAISPLVIAEPHVRRQKKPRDHPAEQERPPLCDRCRHRQAHQRRCVHRRELGHGRGHEDRPSHRAEARAIEGKPFNMAPGVQGGHSWHPNAFSPDTGLIYIPTREAYFPLAEMPYKPQPSGSTSASTSRRRAPTTRRTPRHRQGFMGLQAWDPVTRKMVWETEPSAFARHSPAGNLRRHPGWWRSHRRRDGHGWRAGVRGHGRQG